MLCRLIALFLLLNFMLGCSSGKVKIAESAKSANLSSLAMLPVEYPPDVQREKVDALARAVQSELRNSGFIVLADKIVRQTCSSSPCPERRLLAEKYDVDGFASLSVASVNRTNFIAGFYNIISGTLTISDVNAEPLVVVEHKEAERGGLLFNTGQVFQAVISYEQNREAESFAKLSTAFAQKLVSRLPRPDGVEVETGDDSLTIRSVKVRQLEPEVFELCVDASEGSLVSAIINRAKTNLRPVGKEKYCGAFLYRTSPAEATDRLLTVEARSPFGESVRKEVEVSPELEVCDLADNAIIWEKNGRPTIEIGKTKPCPNHKFIVFRAPNYLGPYKKVAETRSPKWTDNKVKPGAVVYYEVVSVNKSGVWSLPAAPKFVEIVEKS